MIVPSFPSQAPPSKVDDLRLLRKLAGGDRSAGEELVRRSYPMVWRSLLRLCGGDEETASDLTQESYRRAWAALKSFDGRSRFSTWLYRIAYTTFLNHIRRPRKIVPLDEAKSRVLQSVEIRADELLLGNEEDELLRRAVLKLPEPLCETVTARFWGEIPVRELAELNGISEVAVRKRLRKALALLKDHLEVAS